MNVAIEVADLRVIRGRRKVLDGLRLSIQAGRVTGLLGPSGSGKTTLMRCIVGVQRIAGGRVLVLGEPAGSHDLLLLRAGRHRHRLHPLGAGFGSRRGHRLGAAHRDRVRPTGDGPGTAGFGRLADRIPGGAAVPGNADPPDPAVRAFRAPRRHGRLATRAVDGDADELWSGRHDRTAG